MFPGIARRTWLAVGVVFIMGMVVAAPAAAVHRSQISVSPGSLNFGTVEVGTHKILLVYVTNNAKLPQALWDFGDDSDVVYVEDGVATDECPNHDAYSVYVLHTDPGLLPGRTCAFPLSFDPFDPSDAGFVTGQFWSDWRSDILHQTIAYTKFRGTAVNP